MAGDVDGAQHDRAASARRRACSVDPQEHQAGVVVGVAHRRCQERVGLRLEVSVCGQAGYLVDECRKGIVERGSAALDQSVRAQQQQVAGFERDLRRRSRGQTPQAPGDGG